MEGPIPPEAEKTRGVKEPCSTSLIRWSYARLFSLSCRVKTVLRVGVWLEDARGLKTLTSKNASCCGFQNPLHLMSTRLSSWMFAESPCIVSPLSGCSAGSVSVEVLTSSMREAVRSRMSLCQCIGRPPFMQLSRCCTLPAFPQAQVAGSPFGCQPYLRARASLKAPLWRTKQCSSIGSAPSHADAPFC